MDEIQSFLRQFQKEMDWEIKGENFKENRASLLNNYMLLTTEIGEVAEELRGIFNLTYKLVRERGLDEDEAFELSKNEHKENIGKELSDCIAYLVKFANYFDINLNDSFYSKMSEIKLRVNKDQR